MKEGWTYKKLGDIAEIKGGKRLPKGVKLLTTPTKHPYIRVADFNDLGTIDTDDIHYISDSVYEQIKRYIIKKEDVYISIAGTIGKSGIIPDTLNGANLTENACRLILSNNVDQRYVYYFTISPSFIKQIDERTKKSAQPKLALTRLSDVIISYPTIKEQQSIVEYLDSAFAKIDAMKTNAEKALNEAKTLFQAELTECMRPKGGWEKMTIGDLSLKLFAGGDVPKESFSKTKTLKYNIPIVSNGIEHDGLYGFTEFAKVSEPAITISGRGTIGYVVERLTPFFPIIRLITIIPKLDIIGTRFLYFALRNYDFSFSGSSIPQLTVPMVKGARIGIPPIETQHQIVARLDALSANIRKLEEVQRKTIAECDALKQAMLREVFE